MGVSVLMTRQHDGSTRSAIEEIDESDLGEGDVAVAVEWSAVNYKDGLALGGSRIMRRYPLIGGIDFAGTVEHSDHPAFKRGDKVLANGWGLSQTHHGGYAQKARVPTEWLIGLPERFSTRDVMAIGTAGYTAMLCILALEHGGVTPQGGAVLVTGASGGVGSVAISLLSHLGYHVIASTGRPDEADYLRALGAKEILDRNVLSEQGKPIASPQWAAAIDSVGSYTLANVLARTAYRGVVAACGLAQGMELPTSVLPFIQRGVTLAGIDSVEAPTDIRLHAWKRLADTLDLDKLDSTVSEVTLPEVPNVAARILQGKVRGRTVVRI